MTWTEIEAQWPRVRIQARSKWAKLSDDDLSIVGGNRARLITMLEERYGLPTEEGEQHADEWSRHEVTPASRA